MKNYLTLNFEISLQHNIISLLLCLSKDNNCAVLAAVNTNNVTDIANEEVIALTLEGKMLDSGGSADLLALDEVN